MNSPEIIDLTSLNTTDESEPPKNAEEGSSNLLPKKSRKRKRKYGGKSRDDIAVDGFETELVDDSGGSSANQVTLLKNDIFFEDYAPVSTIFPTNSSFNASETVKPSTNSLVLPSHVTIFGENPLDEILAPQSRVQDDEDYIEYLDTDDRKDFVRYFSETTENGNRNSIKIVCSRCGAENVHKTRECPVKICLTCGVHNDHVTRNCPISKICFRCGMKGHLNIDCPNDRQSYGEKSRSWCRRCGANTHMTNECPTQWRMYHYSSPEEQQETLKARRALASIPLGKGGEGYIAEDSWCYNCGGSGHWGDDCDVKSHRYDLPKDTSAFSSYNLTSGPFYNPNAPNDDEQLQRSPREWEQTDDMTLPVPTNVGRKGKSKEMNRMSKQARALEDQGDDPDDWFGNQRNMRNRGAKSPSSPLARGSSAGSSSTRKKFQFTSFQASTEDSRTPNRPKLESRISDSTEKGKKTSKRRGEGKMSPSDRHRREDRYDRRDKHSESKSKSKTRDDDRDRYGSRRKYDDDQRYSSGKRKSDGPRYTGGYYR